MMFDIFREKVFAKAKEKGFEDYELYYSAGDSFSVRVFDGEIAEYKNSASEGAGFRGTYKGKMGYAYTEKLDEALIDQLLANAADNATVIEDEDVEKLYPGDPSYPECITYNPALNNVTADQKIQWALDMEAYAKSLDSRVKMADYCTIYTNEGSIAMANSHGLNLDAKYNTAYAYLIARVEENGITKSGYNFWVGRDFAAFDYKKLVKEAVDMAISYLGAESIPTGEYPIIFTNRSAREIFGVFTSVFIAEMGQKGFSLLNKSRLGEKIAAANITLRDDGIHPSSFDNKGFDAEGVATQQKAIIENGELKTLLYNTKAAAKDGVKSTGNAAKQGFGGAITTSPINFYLQPGEKSYQDIIAGVSSGVIITELAGLHSGANAVSGDFSFSADGFLVENGKIVKPVEQITVAGNFFDMLKNITTVGSDLEFEGNIGMPSLLVQGLAVAGM
ncbi:MAG: TldD/PmbA family protein [Defluviitaleaceae bacterium]|nr:TldD/PmbA family protein [Defluviitaleaceae bacterium]